MASIFTEDGQIEDRFLNEAEIALDGHTPILLASYEGNEEWVEQFGTEPPFF